MDGDIHRQIKRILVFFHTMGADNTTRDSLEVADVLPQQVLHTCTVTVAGFFRLALSLVCLNAKGRGSQTTLSPPLFFATHTQRDARTDGQIRFVAKNRPGRG